MSAAPERINNTSAALQRLSSLAEERELIVRLLVTLLREDVAGLRTRGRQFTNRDGELWLARHRLRIPVRPADPTRDLLSDLAVREPFVLRITPGRRIRATRLHAVITALQTELVRDLEPGPAAELNTGFRALQQEAVAALAAARLRRRRRPLVFGRLLPELVGHPVVDAARMRPAMQQHEGGFLGATGQRGAQAETGDVDAGSVHFFAPSRLP
jgi:hypothetical protein